MLKYFGFFLLFEYLGQLETLFTVIHLDSKDRRQNCLTTHNYRNLKFRNQNRLFRFYRYIPRFFVKSYPIFQPFDFNRIFLANWRLIIWCDGIINLSNITDLNFEVRCKSYRAIVNFYWNWRWNHSLRADLHRYVESGIINGFGSIYRHFTTSFVEQDTIWRLGIIKCKISWYAIGFPGITLDRIKLLICRPNLKFDQFCECQSLSTIINLKLKLRRLNNLTSNVNGQLSHVRSYDLRRVDIHLSLVFEI